jgi:CBS domain-containing protein
MAVREICRRDIVAVTPEALIIEVVHLMMTKRKRRIYVVDEDNLVGVIYRRNLIEKVLHL